MTSFYKYFSFNSHKMFKLQNTNIIHFTPMKICIYKIQLNSNIFHETPLNVYQNYFCRVKLKCAVTLFFKGSTVLPL